MVYLSSIDKAIGVFDSGLGGISVLRELRALLPAENFIYFGDSLYAPYGEASRKVITDRCIAICEFFLTRGVKAIVVACNTATSACIHTLRLRYPGIPIIGMEPALKVATKKGEHQNILVLATSFTLKEKKFASLMTQYEEEHVIYQQPCPRLVEIIEQHEWTNHTMVMQTIQAYLQTYRLEDLHSIVLGCTHFVFFRPYFKELLPPTIDIVDGNNGTARNLRNQLESQGLLQPSTGQGTIQLYNSIKEDDSVMECAKELLQGV